MARKVKRLAVVFAVLSALALPVIALSIVLHGFAVAAQWEVERRGLPQQDHNALKHAYAAAEMYSLARLVVGPEHAAALVVTLGEANEWAERFVKHTTDWSPEVYKDLRNNLSGIAAAEWLYGETGYVWPCTRLQLIGKLVEEDLIIATDEDPRLPDLPRAPDTGSAIAKMKNDEAMLSTRLYEEITARSAELKSDLGLD